MDKQQLQQQVLERLAADLQQAEQAALMAHETATHEENVAENQYDTLGLEAAYLAAGQARRVESIRQALILWKQLQPRPFDPARGIQLGALVCLADREDQQQLFFLGPEGASMKLQVAGQSVQALSSQSPLGRALLGKAEGDELAIKIAARSSEFEVLWVR